jgi:hypothetical protein
MKAPRGAKPGQCKRTGLTDQQVKWMTQTLREEFARLGADEQSKWIRRAEGNGEPTQMAAGAALGGSQSVKDVGAPLSSTGAAGSSNAPSGEKYTACSTLSYNGRKERTNKFRAAWETAAGKPCLEEFAYVVHHALQEGERREFFKTLQKMTAAQQALERALPAEVQQHPEQTGRSAISRAAASSGAARTSLRPGAGPGVRISSSFWERVRRNPQRTQKQKCGRKNVADRPELIVLVWEFLMRHSKDTARFCRTRAERQEAEDKFR